MVAKNPALPILYSVHHASHSFDFEGLNERCKLSPTQRFKFSDYGTAETVPKNTTFLIAQYSRGIIDLNRSPDSKALFRTTDFGKYLNGATGLWVKDPKPTWGEDNSLPVELPLDLKKRARERIYDDYHGRLEAEIRRIDGESQLPIECPIIVVAFDNTADYAIGENPVDKSQRIMPEYVLSNNGDRSKAYADDPRVVTTCDGRFLAKLAEYFKAELSARGLPNDVRLNEYEDDPNDEVGYVADYYNTRKNKLLAMESGREVWSLQLEYNTKITHELFPDEPDRVPTPKTEAITKLQEAFGAAMELTYWKLFLVE